MAQKGTITVEKTGEVFFGVSVTGGKDEGGKELPTVYQPQYEKRGLPGAVYEIVAAEDMRSGLPKGSCIPMKTALPRAVNSISANMRYGRLPHLMVWC